MKAYIYEVRFGGFGLGFDFQTHPLLSTNGGWGRSLRRLRVGTALSVAIQVGPLGIIVAIERHWKSPRIVYRPARSENPPTTPDLVEVGA